MTFQLSSSSGIVPQGLLLVLASWTGSSNESAPSLLSFFTQCLGRTRTLWNLLYQPGFLSFTGPSRRLSLPTIPSCNMLSPAPFDMDPSFQSQIMLSSYQPFTVFDEPRVVDCQSLPIASGILLRVFTLDIHFTPSLPLSLQHSLSHCLVRPG